METVSRRPVPLTAPITPKRFANTERMPMKTPPITVTRGMYRSRYFSSTCGFLRYPGIDIPEFWIWRATSFESMPAVLIQNRANMAPPTTTTKMSIPIRRRTSQGACPRS